MLAAKVKGPDGFNYGQCSVMLDAMNIRKRVDWDRSSNKMTGFVDLGVGGLDCDTQAEATEVLVIMAVGLMGYWKVPLGYFLTHGLSAQLQVQLLKLALQKLYEAGVMCVCVVMDGCSVNQAMVKLLSCSLEPSNLVTSFEHPCAPDMSVSVIFDACHMLKLIRNMLCQYGSINAPGIGTINWSYIVKLHELQQKEGLRAANRLTSAHVFFDQQKMKVKLAAQALSSSVASALSFVRRLGIPGFEGSEATEYFISVVDRLFDIFNSRSPRAKGFKRPLNLSNIDSNFQFLEQAKAFLLSLKTTSGLNVYNSKRSLSVIGFVVNITSLLEMAPRLLSTSKMKYLLTYKFSQDHLELYFSCVRRAGGWNNNPSAKQYAAIHRRLLSRAGVSIGTTGNVLPQDETELLVIHDDERPNKSCFEQPQIDAEFNPSCIANMHLSPFVDDVVGYIAGWVVRKVQQRLKCIDCMECLVSRADGEASSCLIQVKNNGGLVVPSKGMLEIVKQAERVMRSTLDVSRVQNTSAWGVELEMHVLQCIPRTIFQDSQQHFDETCHGVDSHYFSLIRLIVRTYCMVRRFHSVNLTNMGLKGKSVRHHLTKTVLFKGQ